MEMYDIENWLAGTPATDDQKEALLRLSADLHEIYEGADLEDDRTEAFNAGAEVILGDTTTADLIEEVRRQEAHLHQARTRMRAGVLVEKQSATEVELRERYGLARQTIRKALGK